MTSSNCVSIIDRILCPDNIRRLNIALVRTVAGTYNLRIPLQSTNAIETMLLQEYSNWNSDRSTIPADGDPTTADGVVRMLNRQCVRKAARMCVDNYKMRAYFRHDQSTQPIPLPHATNQSVRGTHTTEYVF